MSTPHATTTDEEINTLSHAFPSLLTAHNASGWGPTALPSQFINLPYATFGKSDRLGKVADFTASSSYYNARRDNNTSGNYGRHYHHTAASENVEFQYRHDAAEDKSFQLVDTVKAPKAKHNARLRPWNERHLNPRHNANAAPVDPLLNPHNPHVRVKGQQQQNKRWDRLSNARRMYSRKNRNDVRVDRAPTVTVGADWTLLEQFDLSQLTKLSTVTPEVKDLAWYGALHHYEESYDRITTKSEKPLVRFDHVEFHNVTTTEDPILEALASSAMSGQAALKPSTEDGSDEETETPSLNVYATDAILAHLMTAPRSVLPWDLVVDKVANCLFFDYRDTVASPFHYVTVNETAYDSVTVDDETSMNHPDALSKEATAINQNFSQQILKPDVAPKTMPHPNPFATTSAGTVAYRYRSWDLGKGIELTARCELNGVTQKRGVEEMLVAYALNEWDSKVAKSIEWRQKIDAQRGAILATELKNNSCKLAKWTSQAILAGADQMKLGYVSRRLPSDPYTHVVLGTQTYKPREFASQIALNVNNMWGIIKMLVDIFAKREDGKFVIMKDPNKPVVRIYLVPDNAFSGDEESEAE